MFCICYVHAAIEAEVIIKHAVTVVVTVSQEIIETHALNSANGTAEVILNEKIVIGVLPKSNFIVLEESKTFREIDVSQPIGRKEILFDLRAIDEGEGEIWVVAKQEQCL